MRLTVGNAKGGVAKSVTTLYLALGLARQGRRVLVIDADATNRSIHNWAAAAKEWPADVVVVPWASPDLTRRINAITGDKPLDWDTEYQDVLVDTGPERLDLLRAALLATDQLLIPVSPSPGELLQLGVTLRTAAEVDQVHPVAVRVLLTRVRSRTRSSAAAREYLAGLGVPPMAAQVALRESIPMSWGTADMPLGDYDAVLAELQDPTTTAHVAPERVTA
jgi:chromosome partitioning protein